MSSHVEIGLPDELMVDADEILTLSDLGGIGGYARTNEIHEDHDLTTVKDVDLKGDCMDDMRGMLTLADLGIGCGYAKAEAVMLRTFFLDFDASCGRCRLPVCFVKDYGAYVDDFVMLRDPQNNEIEVHVQKIQNKFYFRDGWYGLKDFYRINLGAWVDITYESPRLLTMIVRNRFGEEITYPSQSSPTVAKLDRAIIAGGLVHFRCATTVVLTSSDAYSGFLMLPWLGFCREVMPTDDTEITVIDYLGFAWSCEFKFVRDDNIIACRIGGNWGNISRSRGFVEGRKLDLAVTKDRENDTLYLRYVPEPSQNDELIRGMQPRMWLTGDAALFSHQDVGNDFDTVQRYAAQLMTYRVEFEKQTRKARLPPCFAKEYGIQIDDHVALRDPKGNITVVQVDNKKGKIYLRQGWLTLRTVYGLEHGAWVYLTYVRPNILAMTIKSRTGVEIFYPDNPSLAIPRFINSVGDVCLVQFFRTYVKILTSSDVESGYLMLRWNGFCRAVFPTQETTLTILDPLGFNWKCGLEFVMDHNTLWCKIGGDWGIICAAHSLTEGNALKLSVIQEKTDVVIVFRQIPLNRIIKQFVKPFDPIGGKYVYQVNQYVM